MNKQAPAAGRIAAMVLFALSCFGLLLFLWIAFGGPIPLKPQGYRFTTSFSEATQLAQEADVRISGVPVGRVKAITPDRRTGRSNVVIELESRYAPLPSDARAVLRQKTLLGETYVELTPGTATARKIPENGVLSPGRVSDTVELDEIFRSFDPRTRRAFQTWMQQQAAALEGRGRDLNDALGNLGPFAEDAAKVAAILDRQSAALRRTVENTGVVFEALTERRGQLRALVRNANRVFAATAANDRRLREAFTALPTFERESRLTVRRLADFARRTDPLVTQLRPAARQLSPTLRGLRELAPDLRALFEALDPLITASERGFPAGERVLRDIRPLLEQLDPAGRQLVPVLAFLGQYRRELVAFFANATAATQAAEVKTQGRVHYLRTTNPLNPENLAVYPRRIGTNRTNPYVKPDGFDAIARRGRLESFETRHCANGVPSIAASALAGAEPGTGTGTPAAGSTFDFDPQLGVLGDPDFVAQVQRFAIPRDASGRVPAPPCVEQAPYGRGATLSKYPRVRALRP